MNVDFCFISTADQWKLPQPYRDENKPGLCTVKNVLTLTQMLYIKCDTKKTALTTVASFKINIYICARLPC